MSYFKQTQKQFQFLVTEILDSEPHLNKTPSSQRVIPELSIEIYAEQQTRVFNSYCYFYTLDLL